MIQQVICLLLQSVEFRRLDVIHPLNVLEKVVERHWQEVILFKSIAFVGYSLTQHLGNMFENHGSVIDFVLIFGFS